MTGPLVSIVVPSRNHAWSLESCLRSLLGQTYPRIEVIVRDALSDDGTEDILARHAHRLSAIRREADGGQADALAKGFAESRGEILAWLNADDMLMPDAVERAVAALERAETDVVYGHCAFLDERGQFRGYFPDIQAFSR